MNELSGQKFWEAGDRESYIETRLTEKTAAGLTPTRSVAARWFNLMTIISETVGDIWIHKDGNRLWWTTSRADPPFFISKTEPVGRKREVVVCHKPCDPWRDQSKLGNRLDWNAVHPKAKDFLITESTLQQLNPDNAEYVLTLISGGDLASWHTRQSWKEKEKGSRSSGVVFNTKQIAVARMAATALSTTANANGQDILRTVKNKEFRFPDKFALEKYLLALIDMQEGLCAISGLRLQFDKECDDPEMLCSLDRRDSNGHYEAENLQVICKFINRWKSADDDAGFRRLIQILKSIA